MGRRCVRVADVECVRETDKAILCVFHEEDGLERWIPKSWLSDDSEVYEEDDHGDLVIFEYWAEQEGIDGEEYQE